MDISSGPSQTSKLEIFGWCMFDFANSSYTTVIVSVVFSVYFVKVVAGGGRHAEFLWSVGLLISNMAMVVLSPVIGALADDRGQKKRMLFLTYVTCVVFTALLYFAGPGQIGLALGLFIISNSAFGVGEHINSSFLPEISSPDNIGRISGYGWALGYVGGIVSLALCIPLVAGGIDLDNLSKVRWTNVAVAGFFLVSAIPTFLFLKERKYLSPVGVFKRLSGTFHSLGRYRELEKFLAAFFIYIAGLSIVIAFAAIFAERNLGFESLELIELFLILQVSSSLGAFVFGLFQDRIGAKATIQICLLIWVAVVAGAYLAQTQQAFYVVGNLAGIAIGATQSASRTVVGLLTPVEKTAEIFGYMGVFWKLSQAFGPFTYGIATSLLNSSRNALFVPFLYFLLGMIALHFVRIPRKRTDPMATN